MPELGTVTRQGARHDAGTVRETRVRRWLAAGSFGAFYEKWGITVFLVLFVVAAGLVEPAFGNVRTLQSVLREAAFVGVAAIGMTLAIMSGVFDLSVGAILALASVLSLQALPAAGVPGALGVAVLAGIASGLVNGSLVAGLRIPAFVATLGTLFVFRGLTFIVTRGAPVRVPTERFGGTFTQIGSGDLFGVPIPFIVMVAAYGVGYVLLRRTPFGRRLLAVGSSEPAARFCGISPGQVRLLTFALLGAFTGLAAILLTTRTWTADGGTQQGFELVVIATVVLGGTSLAGGKGTLIGTFSATLLVTALQRFLLLTGVPSFYQGIVTGLILLLALSIDGLRLRFSEPGSLQRALGRVDPRTILHRTA